MKSIKSYLINEGFSLSEKDSLNIIKTVVVTGSNDLKHGNIKSSELEFIESGSQRIRTMDKIISEYVDEVEEDEKDELENDLRLKTLDFINYAMKTFKFVNEYMIRYYISNFSM